MSNKYFIFLSLLCVCFTNCENAEVLNNVSKYEESNVKVSFGVEKMEGNSRLVFQDDLNFAWEDGDKVGFFCEPMSEANISADVKDEDGNTITTPTIKGTFSSDKHFVKENGDFVDHKFYLYYPYSTDPSVTYNPANPKLSMTLSQNQLASTSVRDNGFMYATTTVAKETLNDLGTDETTLHVGATFKHPFSYLYFSLKGDAEYVDWTVTDMALITPTGTKLVGTCEVDLDAETFTFGDMNYYGECSLNDVNLTLTSDYQKAGVMVVNPVDLSGKELTAIFKLKKDGQTKYLYRNFNGIKFLAQTRHKISLTVKGTESTMDEPANCHIISDDNALLAFPLTQGNTLDPLDGTVKSVGFLWSDDARNCDLSLLCDVENFVIYIQPIQSSFPESNIVIAAYDQPNQKGNILWSWHLWLTNADFYGTGSENIHHYTNGGVDYYVMDRNLGALSATPDDKTAWGLFYQWGRKDPWFNKRTDCKYDRWKKAYGSFGLTGADTDVTKHLSDCIANPETFYTGSKLFRNAMYKLNWGYFKLEKSAKQKQDPCPHGYRVSPYDFVSNVITDYEKSPQMDVVTSPYRIGGFLYKYDSGDPSKKSYIPAQGNRSYSSGGIEMNFCTLWSASSNSSATSSQSSGIQLKYDSSVNPTQVVLTDNYRNFGRAVRCVKE